MIIDPISVSVVMTIVLLAAIVLSMAVIGAAGYMAISSPAALQAYLSNAWPDKFLSYDLAIVPLCILMGHLATRTGISAALFAASNVWIGHWRGGLAMAGCALFGSISGSSIATASTMARVALPEMKKHRYGVGVACGGGTLGILIPPSIVLIIYALLTEQNIIKLFLAATVPGILAILGFVIAIAIYARIFPEQAPLQDKAPLMVRIRTLSQIWHIVSIFVIVLGGIYGGLFTPAEGASIGVVLTAAAGLFGRTLTVSAPVDSLIDTAAASAMIFAIIFGADIFNVAIALSRMPTELTDYFIAAQMAPMTVLTVPVFCTKMMSLDFGLLPEISGAVVRHPDIGRGRGRGRGRDEPVHQIGHRQRHPDGQHLSWNGAVHSGRVHPHRHADRFPDPQLLVGHGLVLTDTKPSFSVREKYKAAGLTIAQFFQGR